MEKRQVLSEKTLNMGSLVIILLLGLINCKLEGEGLVKV